MCFLSKVVLPLDREGMGSLILLNLLPEQAVRGSKYCRCRARIFRTTANRYQKLLPNLLTPRSPDHLKAPCPARKTSTPKTSSARKPRCSSTLLSLRLRFCGRRGGGARGLEIIVLVFMYSMPMLPIKTRNEALQPQSPKSPLTAAWKEGGHLQVLRRWWANAEQPSRRPLRSPWQMDKSAHVERDRERKLERDSERGREAERQRDGETERQRARQTERQG